MQKLLGFGRFPEVAARLDKAANRKYPLGLPSFETGLTASAALW